MSKRNSKKRGKLSDSKQQLLRFIEKSPALDNTSKLKLILFVAGAKPSTYVRLRIEKNLHDRHKFEELLKANNVIFDVSRAKGFEEIARVRGNTAVWKMRGTWYGYDLFSNKKYNARFLKYVMLLRQQSST